MIDLRPGLRTFLLADSSIAAIVGTRIYPVQMPQGVIDPSLVYNRISGLGDNKMDGRTGLSRPRMQIDAWAQSHDSATTLANLVKDRIDGYRGLMGTVTVQGCFFESERDTFDDTAMLFGVSRDYFIWYEEL